MQVSQDTQYLVSFVGNSGHLFTAKLGGNSLDLWSPPKADSAIVLKPQSTTTLHDDSETIVRLDYRIITNDILLFNIV